MLAFTNRSKQALLKQGTASFGQKKQLIGLIRRQQLAFYSTSAKEAQLEDGEYLGTYRQRRAASRIDDIMSSDISKESLLESEQSMKERFDQLTGKLGVEFEKDAAKQKPQKVRQHLSKDNAQF